MKNLRYLNKLVAGRCLIILIFLSMFFVSNTLAEPCPTFHLRTDDGKIINPLTGKNANQPYSTRQTCGACHDYETISKAYHFNMGWSTADDLRFADTEMPWRVSLGMAGSF